ncbi:MAG: SET domain-containing protein [Elusimicrobia bacterium]|nr:SET domain-containing protein [Elusimicrobiota bacterium]
MLVRQGRRRFCLRPPRGLQFVYVHGKGLSLFARKTFAAGEKVIGMEGEVVRARSSSPEAVQFDEDHFIDTDRLVAGDFINHSCDPNMKADLPRRQFVAIRRIGKGSEITYNYLTTEWDMKAFGTDFRCRCGSDDCVGFVRGFKYLDRRQRERLRPILSPFLLSKLA